MKRRRSHGLANDQRIFDAAIKLLAQEGIEGFNAREVAGEAGLTYGAVYARYTSIPELLADLWLNRLQPEFEALAETALQLAGARGKVVSSAWKPLFDASDTRCALVEACIAATRIDNLTDIIPDALGQMIARVRAQARSQGVDEGWFLGLLGMALGSIAHAPHDGPWSGAPPGPAPESAASVPEGRKAGATPSGKRPTATPARQFEFPEPRGGCHRVRLLNAAIKVVARSGIADINLRRISRAAGQPQDNVYPFYGTLEELLEDMVLQHHARLPSPAQRLALLEDPSAAARSLEQWMQPESHTARRLFLEFLLGTVHHPILGPKISRADARSYANVARLRGAPGTAAYRDTLRALRVQRDVTFGVVLMHEAAGGLDPANWQRAAAPWMLTSP